MKNLNLSTHEVKGCHLDSRIMKSFKILMIKGPLAITANLA